jgi:hypothetical protein
MCGNNPRIVCTKPYKIHTPQTACGYLNLIARHNFSKRRVDFSNIDDNLMEDYYKINRGFQRYMESKQLYTIL